MVRRDDEARAGPPPLRVKDPYLHSRRGENRPRPAPPQQRRQLPARRQQAERDRREAEEDRRHGDDDPDPERAQELHGAAW